MSKIKMMLKKLAILMIISSLLVPNLIVLGDSKTFLKSSSILQQEEEYILTQEDIRRLAVITGNEQIEERGHIKRLVEYETGDNCLLFENTDRSRTVYFFSFPVKEIDANGRSEIIDISERNSRMLLNSSVIENHNIEDAPVYSAIPNSNFGNNIYNCVGYLNSSYGNGKVVIRLQGLIENPLLTTFSSENILDAQLYIKDSSGKSSKSVSLYAIDTDVQWMENSVTWSQLQSANIYYQSSTNLGNGKWTNFNITNYIRNCLNGTYEMQDGLLLKMEDNSSSRDFFSSEHSSTSNRPYFTITYEYGETSSLENGQTYFIRNVFSGKYLQADPSLDNDIFQNVFHGNSYQQWKIKYEGNGLYKLYNQYEGYIGNRCCLDLVSQYGSRFDMFYDTQQDYVMFYIIPNGDGTYRLLNYWPRGDAVLSVPDQYALSEVINASWQGDSKQKWVFELANDKLANMLTFSAIDMGDSAEDEIALFSRYFTHNGFINVGSYHNALYQFPKEVVRDVGRYSDVIYINGHGGQYANLYVQNSNGVTNAYVCAEDSVNIGDTLPKIGIGALWKNSNGTISTSYWNKKTKWGILAQCSQLNYGTDGDGNCWNGINSAQIWARTMLGDGSRMHGYLGYYEGAPIGSIHYNRLENFLIHSSVDNDVPVVNAWKTAHTTLTAKTNWAVLYNSVNSDDTFSEFTDNSPSGSSYTIYLTRREAGTVSLNSSALSLSNVNPTMIFTTKCYPSLSAQQISSEYKENLYAVLSKELGVDDKSKLEIDDYGNISFNKNSEDLSRKINARFKSEEEAVEYAVKRLSEMNLLTSDENYRVSVSKIVRYDIDEKLEDSQVLDYEISFYRTFEGIDVISDKGEGILVLLNENGINSLQYQWSNLIINETYEEEKNFISKEEIYKKYIEIMPEAENPVIIPIWFQKDDKVYAAWACMTDDSYCNSAYFDYRTGEFLGYE